MDFVKMLDLKAGDKLDIEVKDGKLVITPKMLRSASRYSTVPF